jgi:hypothetical protein
MGREESFRGGENLNVRMSQGRRVIMQLDMQQETKPIHGSFLDLFDRPVSMGADQDKIHVHQ